MHHLLLPWLLSPPGPITPDLVIFGFGGSGTRGIHDLLEGLGFQFCHSQEDHVSKDNNFTKTPHYSVGHLLNASQGKVADAAGHKQYARFADVVTSELEGAALTKRCIDEERRGLNLGNHSNFSWGFKNPQHLYLLPVMDNAYSSRERIMAVAADPRHICSSRNDWQFRKFSDSIVPEEPASANYKKFPHLDSVKKCYVFWARVWLDLLQHYGQDERFRVVRIEDFVSPEQQSDATRAVDCVATHAKLGPPEELKRAGLNHMQSFRKRYGGRRLEPKRRRKIEAFVSVLGGEVHEAMRALGYRTDGFGLTTPASGAVCR